MSKKRLFSTQITESDAFLDMPLSAQSLYFHLGMNADDEGFVNSPKRIQRMVGASEDDFKILVAKRFLIAFPSGVIVIKHWHINNNIRMDRMRQTEYQDERRMLKMKTNRSYTLISADLEELPDSCPANDRHMPGSWQPNDRLIQSNLIQSNINQSVNSISKLITNKDMDRLTECYADVPKLLELVDHRIKQRSSQTPIKNPYGYVTAIAREENWPTKEEADRKASAREARLREIEEQEQKDIDRLNEIARKTFGG